MNFEINLIFLVKAVLDMTKNSRQIQISWEAEEIYELLKSQGTITAI